MCQLEWHTGIPQLPTTTIRDELCNSWETDRQGGVWSFVDSIFQSLIRRITSGEMQRVRATETVPVVQA